MDAAPAGIPEAIARHAAAAPERTALLYSAEPWGWARFEMRCTWRDLARHMDRIAASLVRAGIAPQQEVAVAAKLPLHTLAVLLGAARAGIAVTVLPVGLDPQTLKAEVARCGARLLFLDRHTRLVATGAAPVVLDDTAMPQWSRWLVSAGSPAPAVESLPQWRWDTWATAGALPAITHTHAQRMAAAWRGALAMGPADTIDVAGPVATPGALDVVWSALLAGRCVALRPTLPDPTEAAGPAPVEQGWQAVPVQLRAQARLHPRDIALRTVLPPHDWLQSDQTCTYGDLEAMVDRVAASLRRDGVQPQQVVALWARDSVASLMLLLGAGRAGVAVVVVPDALPAGQARQRVLASGARRVFIDPQLGDLPGVPGCISLAHLYDPMLREPWLVPPGEAAPAVDVRPGWRWDTRWEDAAAGPVHRSHGEWCKRVARAAAGGLGAGVALAVRTPFAQEETLACILATLVGGGSVVLTVPWMRPEQWQAARQRLGVTHEAGDAPRGGRP